MIVRVRARTHAKALTALVAIALVGLVWHRTATSVPELPTAVVRHGAFENVLTLRGEVRPFRSVTLAAPSRGGDLRILRIAKTGTRVQAGDTVIEFDRTMVLRTLSEKRSQLKRAEAEVDRIRAQRQIGHRVCSGGRPAHGEHSQRAVEVRLGRGDSTFQEEFGSTTGGRDD